ncbi:hypothetical protein QAD02_005280 [Eretmocerus hayati]|uniref:Uncharacterized protein n=1 Tax=Eretmocerus hayati TaxID=131215 RepID=A0ACC2NS37_9HYME|nr:hypothetical protein QAD02_005280 [Eretmocerus hayati]
MADEDILMDHMFNCIQNVSSPYKVNIFSEILDGLSTLANKIVQRVNRDFPSNNLDHTLISKMIEWTADDAEDSVSYNFKCVPERVSLAVGVIDSKNISQTSAEMEKMLGYFQASNPFTRGKYLINIVTSERFSFMNFAENFFRRAWQRKFIDLTVIEWIQEEQVEKAPFTVNFHLMREKTYEVKVSLAAIITFGVLIFTAFIFAVWARLLGFRRQNWSFLNMLTVQMGGSIAHQGPMKLSEKVFQMSIYIATFVLVTVGTDFMLEIFVSIPTLTEIRTIQDLADSDIDLVVDHTTYEYFRPEYYLWIRNDPAVKKIFDRLKPARYATEFHHSFCQRPTSNSLSLDESINLCITNSYYENQVMMSDDTYQIDNIQDPIISFMPYIELSDFPSLFKSCFQDMVNRFLEVGIIKIWEGSKMEYHDSEPRISDKASIENESEDPKIPLKKQLLPIFVAGSILSFSALICELIWKNFIEKTQFGVLARAFYCNFLSSSVDGNITIKLTLASESIKRLKSAQFRLPLTKQKKYQRALTVHPIPPPCTLKRSRVTDSSLQDGSDVVRNASVARQILTPGETDECYKVVTADVHAPDLSIEDV